ncbi:restriction endonuclease S subunit [Mycobacteroides abscessus subsp. abscessus]|nr:restriction endonuclease S subunit [Mycobacteroides abscessus subsp. abscessus]
MVALGDVAQLNPSTPKLAPGDEVNFVGMADLDAERAQTQSDSIRPFNEVSKGYTVFADGDILVAKITPCFENSKIGQAKLLRKIGVGSTEFHVIRPTAHIHDRYLLHYLRQGWIRSKGEMRMTGSAGQRRVPASFLQALELPLPSLDDQRRIAAILDQADAVNTKLRKVIANLEILSQSIFTEMFGGSPTRPLGEYLTFITSGGRGWAKYYASEGDPFVRSLDVQTNRVAQEDMAFVAAPDNAEARRTRTQTGDVLLTITGSRIGRAAPLPDTLNGSYVSQHVAILRPDPESLLPDFLSSFLCAPTHGQIQIASAQYGQTKPGLNFEQIRDFRVPRVALSRQREFHRRLTHVQHLQESAVAETSTFGSLFTSLQSRAFKGEL